MIETSEGSSGDCVFLMGLTWFRQGEIVEKATRKATDVIRAKLVTANDDYYALAA